MIHSMCQYNISVTNYYNKIYITERNMLDEIK